MRSAVKKWRSIPFVYKMLGALVLGAVTGFIFGERVTAIAWIGTLFMRLLQMAAMPLIFFSLIAGVASLDDPQLLGKVGLKIMCYYILTTLFAATIGCLSAMIFSPGSSLVLTNTAVEEGAGEMTSIGTTLLEMIPTNIFESLASGTLVAAIVFGTFAGIGIVLMKDKEAQVRLRNGVKDIADMLLRVVEMIMGLAPFGVFALIANTVGTNGSNVIGFIGKYIVTLYSCLIFMVILYNVVVFIFTRITPGKFMKKALPSFITSFSTCSSLASMPVNLKTAESFGLPRKIYGFTIPLGAQINKDGTAILITTSCLAAGQAIGMTLGVGEMIQMIVTVLIITTGIAGVPGGTVVLLTLFSTTFGFPTEVAAVIMGAFAIMEMGITASNIVGDLAGTIIVSYPECKNTEEFKRAMSQ